jgi:hypothetical protein
MYANKVTDFFVQVFRLSPLILIRGFLSRAISSCRSIDFQSILVPAVADGLGFERQS